MPSPENGTTSPLQITLQNQAQVGVSDMIEGKNYAFYESMFKDNWSDLYPKKYSEILASAVRKIEICDSYFFNVQDTYNAFSAICTPMLLEFHIILDDNNFQRRNQVRSTFEQKIGGKYSVLKYYKMQGNAITHDRYLIIDEKDYYLIGSSALHHSVLKETATGICQICEDEDKLIIRDLFDRRYAIATQNNMIV